MKTVLFAAAATLALSVGLARADDPTGDHGPAPRFPTSMLGHSLFDEHGMAPAGVATARITPKASRLAPAMMLAQTSWASPNSGGGAG